MNQPRRKVTDVRHCTPAADGRATSPPCSRLHAIPARRMRLGQPCPPRAEQFLAQRPVRIRALVPSPSRQLRHQHVGDILEIARRNRKRNIEAVDVGLFEPGLDIVGDFLRRADHDRADAADADMLGDLAHGPDAVRIGAGDVVHRRAAGVVLDVADLLVELVGREIDAGPARHQRQRALVADVAADSRHISPSPRPRCGRG